MAEYDRSSAQPLAGARHLPQASPPPGPSAEPCVCCRPRCGRWYSPARDGHRYRHCCSGCREDRGHTYRCNQRWKQRLEGVIRHDTHRARQQEQNPWEGMDASGPRAGWRAGDSSRASWVFLPTDGGAPSSHGQGPAATQGLPPAPPAQATEASDAVCSFELPALHLILPRTDWALWYWQDYQETRRRVAVQREELRNDPEGARAFEAALAAEPSWHCISCRMALPGQASGCMRCGFDQRPTYRRASGVMSGAPDSQATVAAPTPVPRPSARGAR